MNRSVSDYPGQLIVILVTLLPFVNYATIHLVGRDSSAILFFLALVAIYFLFLQKGNLMLSYYLIAYGFFVLYTVFSDVFIVSKNFDLQYIRNNRFITSFLLLVIIDNLHIPEKFGNLILKGMVFTVTASVFVLFVQRFMDMTFFLDMEKFNAWKEYNLPLREYRLPSIFSWVETNMAFGLCFMPLMALIIGVSYKHGVKLFYIYGLYIISFAVTFINRSRITIVLALSLLLLHVVYKGIKIKNLFFLMIFLVISIATVYYTLETLGVDAKRIVQEDILDKDSGGIAEGSAGTRILAFSIFAEIFPDHPVWGRGNFLHRYDNGKEDVELKRLLGNRTYQIHVGYLSLLVYYGIFGGAIYLLSLVLLSYKLLRDARFTGYWAPLTGWIMFLLNLWTDVFLSLDIMSIVLILFFNNYYLQRKEGKTSSGEKQAGTAFAEA